MIKIERFAPDADFSVPGVIVECDHFVPSVRGYKSAPAASDPSLDALASTCYGAVVARKLDNSTRFIAGAATKLYELSGASWSDVSSVTYGAATDARWDFAQFGNITLATNKNDYLQESTSGTFTAISGAPKAALVETVNNFVIVANTNDAGFGDSPDRWWCSAVGDHTDWTPNVATQCVSGRLTSSPGRINALRRLGDAVVAYKDRSIFVGSYVGAPEVWNFQEIPGQIGCPAQGGVQDIGAAHVFMGNTDFWIFDGSRPQPIGGDIRTWFFSNLFQDYAYRVQTVHDRRAGNVYFYFPSANGSGSLDSCVVYNYRAGKWGVDSRTVEATVDYISAGLTFASSFATGTTFTGVEAGLAFDSPLLVAGQPAPAYFNASHDVMLLTGTGGSWNFTTNDFGDDSDVTTITRVKPRFLTAPTTALMNNYHRMVMGDALTLDKTTTYSNGRFDVIRSARWHRLAISGTGSMEVTGINVEGTGAGIE